MPCLNSAAGEMTSSKAPAQTFAYRNEKGRNLVFWVRLLFSSPYVPLLRFSVFFLSLPLLRSSLMALPNVVYFMLLCSQSGSSKINNKAFQGGCESQLEGYYQNVPSGIPITGPNNRLQFVCNADSENAVAAFELK